MHVHIKIPDDLNETRKALSVSWIQVIHAGLSALKANPASSLDYPSLELNLKAAISSLTKVWDTIKKAR